MLKFFFSSTGEKLLKYITVFSRRWHRRVSPKEAAAGSENAPRHLRVYFPVQISRAKEADLGRGPEKVSKSNCIVYTHNQGVGNRRILIIVDGCG
jgi:hypothetical protein